MSSGSPFVYPVGDGIQVIHEREIQAARAQKELPAATFDSLRPLSPALDVTGDGGWTCPGGLDSTVWASPVVQPDRPDGRRFGVHCIEVDGSTGPVDPKIAEPPQMRLVVDGRTIDNILPVATKATADLRREYSYTASRSITGTASPQVQIMAYQVGGDLETKTALPTVQVAGLSIRITSIWFS